MIIKNVLLNIMKFNFYFFSLTMSLTKERVDQNIEKILYNNKPASLSGIIEIKDISKKGWIVVDCTHDEKISKGLSNVAKQLNIKINIEKFYCKNENTNISLNENEKCKIVADVFLSKGVTLYGKITQIISTHETENLSDSINVSNKETKSKKSKKINENVQTFSNNITLSDDTLNKIRIALRESFSEVLQESIQNISNLVEVIKELAEVIDKKGNSSLNIDNKQDIPFDEHFEHFDLPDNDDDKILLNENEQFDLPNNDDEKIDLPNNDI